MVIETSTDKLIKFLKVRKMTCGNRYIWHVDKTGKSHSSNHIYWTVTVDAPDGTVTRRSNKNEELSAFISRLFLEQSLNLGFELGAFSSLREKLFDGNGCLNEEH